MYNGFHRYFRSFRSLDGLSYMLIFFSQLCYQNPGNQITGQIVGSLVLGANHYFVFPTPSLLDNLSITLRL